MGKSLSILAITTQVYNINGWSIYPPHLALGDDVELPISMEHLRPYLRKRKGPIIAPPGLRHNQRYYPKVMQSRKLLMDQNSVQEIHGIIQQIQEQIHQAKMKDHHSSPKAQASGSNHFSEPTTETFTTIFVDYLREKEASRMSELKKLYQSLRFEQEFVMFLNEFIRILRNKEKEQSKIDTKGVRGILTDIISIDRGYLPQYETDKDKLMITLESLSKDLIGDEVDKLWIYSTFHGELFHIAKDSNMQIVPSLAQLSTNTKAFPESGIIWFSSINHYKRSEPCQSQLKYYTDLLAPMINSDKYPYLKSAKGRFTLIGFLKMLFRECNFQSDDDKRKVELIFTLKEVMKNMMATNTVSSKIMNYALWQYVIDWGLIPNDEEIQNGIANIYGDCIKYLEVITQQREQLPFLEGKHGFLVQMKYLIKAFDHFHFSNSVQSQSPSQFYQRLHFMKVQYKEWQFDPEVIDYINTINLAEKKTIGIRNVLKLITSSNDQEKKGEEAYNILVSLGSNNDKLMITLESLTRDIVNVKYDDDNIWKYKYLYSLIYDRSVADGLIPSDKQRQDPGVVKLSDYPLAQTYDIIIFTGDNIKYEGKSDADKDAVLNSMSGETQKYPFLPIMIKERLAVINGTQT